MSILAERIKARRRQLKLSQSEVACIAGVSQMAISRYEVGEFEPVASVLAGIAYALQTTPDWLLGFPEAPHETSLTEAEREVLHLFRSKEPHRRSNILEIVRVAN
jgi:transcriptional regulator with XRE-family HTH domain